MPEENEETREKSIHQIKGKNKQQNTQKEHPTKDNPISESYQVPMGTTRSKITPCPVSSSPSTSLLYCSTASPSCATESPTTRHDKEDSDQIETESAKTEKRRGELMEGHDAICSVLSNRLRNLKILRKIWNRGGSSRGMFLFFVSSFLSHLLCFFHSFSPCLFIDSFCYFFLLFTNLFLIHYIPNEKIIS